MRVEDENDNAPEFRFPSYPVTISEAVLSNTTFLTVFASDIDLGRNAEITYTIVEGNTSGNEPSRIERLEPSLTFQCALLWTQ